MHQVPAGKTSGSGIHFPFPLGSSGNALGEESEVVRIGCGRQRCFIRDSLLLVELHEGLIEGLHSVRYMAFSYGVSDFSHFPFVTDTFAYPGR